MKLKAFKLVQLIIFVSMLVFGITGNVSPTFADDDLGCPSHVVAEGTNGMIYCIPKINTDQDSNNQTTDNAAYIGGCSYTYEFGYRSDRINVGTNDNNNDEHVTCNAWGINGQNQNDTVPLYMYTGNRECTDNASENTGISHCSDIINQGGANSIVQGTNNQIRLNSKDACVFVELGIDGKQGGFYYCNSEVLNICSDQSQLRASINGDLRANIKGLTFFCDQNAGTIGVDHSGCSIPGAATPVTQAYQSPSINPSIMTNFPSLGQCCSATDASGDSVNSNDGSQINSNASGITYHEVSGHVTKSDTSHTCTYNSGTLAHVSNCAVSSYASAHSAECTCTYDSVSKAANGNTYTALGCIPSNVGSVINIFLSIAIAVAGVLALIMMLIGGYEIMTNPAGPEEIQEGQKYIVNAVLGLLLIIFCIIILRIIGVDILGINELSKLIGS